ncbi:MAG: hypothetical protein WBY44_13040 [Bryobacteraceae bacterium]
MIDAVAGASPHEVAVLAYGDGPEEACSAWAAASPNLDPRSRRMDIP